MKLVIVCLLLVSLLVPFGATALAIPFACEHAYYTHRLEDVLFCGLVLIAELIIPDDGTGVPIGWQ
ncbi:MAG: hypothetical protein JW952_00160 [Candidatus Eisenbacteria bacterium]|nr:hypothetical protein [Candidatus Eisenbacteria bacterium]